MCEEEIPKTAKHYSVCDIEKCENNCQFYCISCHLQLCEQCSYNHWNSLESKSHELASYPQCTRQLPEEKWKLHPTRNLYILCKECNSPLCTKCMFMEDHSSHQMDDLENHYLKKVAFCQIEISKIQEYFLPKGYRWRCKKKNKRSNGRHQEFYKRWSWVSERAGR